MKTILSRPYFSRISWAHRRWARWIGSKVPPRMPHRMSSALSIA